MALKAKSSPLSPRQPLPVSHPPTARRAGRCGQAARPPPPPVEPSATLTLSPQRRGPPWTWRPGPRPPHACSAHSAPSERCPPHPPRAAAGASAWGTRSLCARRPGCTGPPRVQHLVGTADRIPDSVARPRGRPLPRLLPARPAAWLRPRVAQPPPVTNAVRRTTSAPMLT